MSDSDKPIDDFLSEFLEEPADSSAVEDPEDARIRELEATLSKPIPSFDGEDEEEKPLTEKQLRIKELEDQVARRTAAVSENSAPEYVMPTGKGETLLLHFLIDGFVAFGQTWFRGQEIEIEIGGPAWKRTLDRNGDTWLKLADKPQAQLNKWGKQYFGVGPFTPLRGERFDDSIVAEDARRGRAVPMVRF